MEWARWEPLMYELKEHEKIGDNIDLLISELCRKKLLHIDVRGSTASERVEMLFADLNTMFNSHSDSFFKKFLEVLQSIPAFEDLAVQYTNNHESADSKSPEQETDSGNAADRHFDNAQILTVRPSVEPEPKIQPALVEGRHDVCETSGRESHPQEEHSKEIEIMKLKVTELSEKCEKLQRKKDEEVEYLKHKLMTTEIRAECAEQAKHEAEQQVVQQERGFQIERSASRNQIQELQVEIVQLKEQLDEAQRKQVWRTEELKEAREKVVHLQIRVNQLEQEKEEICSAATDPLIPLKPFIKDVEPAGEDPLGSGCYGSVVKVIRKSTREIFAAKKFRSDFVKEKNFEKKFDREFTLLHQLEHKHIVHYIGYTILQDSEFPALLMEQLDTDLHTYLESGRTIPLGEKAQILLGVGKGLEYLHGQHVLHRDLTARNVLLKVSKAGSCPFAKIADFGNSRIMTTDPTIQLESSSGLPGTLVYLPPEAHTGNYNDKLDIFSFGHIALFVCTQFFTPILLPTKHTITLADGTKERLIRSEVERRKEYFDKLYDKQYLPLMKRCLDDDAEERPSGSEVVSELERIHTTILTDDVVDSPVETNDSNGRAARLAESEPPIWLQGSGEPKIDIN